MIAVIAGTAGAVVSNPFEVAMVRNISDLGKSAPYTHGYSSLGSALAQIKAEPKGYFRGLGPNIAKSVVLNAFLIGPYDYLKERLYITFGDVWVNTPLYLPR